MCNNIQFSVKLGAVKLTKRNRNCLQHLLSIQYTNIPYPNISNVRSKGNRHLTNNEK